MLYKRDLNKIQRELSSYDLHRERMLRITRESIKLSSIAIIHIHRQDLKKAFALIKKAENLLRTIEKFFSQPLIKDHSNILVAYQELVEAKALLKLITADKILTYDESKVSMAPYLLGLLDLIGELRRLVLNNLRMGEVTEAEKFFSIMEKIYEDLSSLDHTPLIPTFRHKLDVARHINESTRGDIVTETRRYSLEKALKKFESRIEIGKLGGKIDGER